jgi:hypothetical protein
VKLGTVWGRFVETTRDKKSRATVPLRAQLFKGPIVYRPDSAGPDCAGSDSVGPDCAGPDHTCTILELERGVKENFVRGLP